MRTSEWQNAGRHLRPWAPTLFVAFLLFSFAFTALEVTKGEPIAFDRWLMVAFRHASDLSRPIGPAWLLDVVRDITALGSTAVLALLVTIVTTFLFRDRQASRGFVRPDNGPEWRSSQYPSQAYLRASAPRYRHSTHPSLYT